MKMQLLMPRLSAAMSEGTLVTWHKEAGDPVAYGDELCEIMVGEVKRLRRRLSARLAVERRSPRRSKYRTLEGVTVRFRLVSSEAGVLGEIVAPPGTAVKEGDLLAVISSSAEPPADQHSSSSVATARVVANLLGPSMEESSS